MRILHLLYLFLCLSVFTECSNPKTSKVIITFEFETPEQKSMLQQRIHELNFNQLEEIESATDYEWTISFESEFSEYTTKRLFKNENSFVIAQCIDLDYIVEDIPNLFQSGIVTPNNPSDQMGMFDEEYTSSIMKEIDQYKTAHNEPWLHYYITDNFDEQGHSFFVLSMDNLAVDFSQYVTKLVITKEDRQKVGHDTEFMQLTMAGEGIQLLSSITSLSENYHLLMLSHSKMVALPRVNGAITQGTVEITGDDLFKDMLSQLLLKDLPGAKITFMDLILK